MKVINQIFCKLTSLDRKGVVCLFQGRVCLLYLPNFWKFWLKWKRKKTFSLFKIWYCRVLKYEKKNYLCLWLLFLVWALLTSKLGNTGWLRAILATWLYFPSDEFPFPIWSANGFIGSSFILISGGSPLFSQEKEWFLMGSVRFSFSSMSGVSAVLPLSIDLTSMGLNIEK